MSYLRSKQICDMLTWFYRQFRNLVLQVAPNSANKVTGIAQTL